MIVFCTPDTIYVLIGCMHYSQRSRTEYFLHTSISCKMKSFQNCSSIFVGCTFAYGSTCIRNSYRVAFCSNHLTVVLFNSLCSVHLAIPMCTSMELSCRTPNCQLREPGFECYLLLFRIFWHFRSFHNTPVQSVV